MKWFPFTAGELFGGIIITAVVGGPVLWHVFFRYN